MEEFEATTKVFVGDVPTEVIDIASLGESLVLVKNSKVSFSHELAQKILMYEAVPWERDLKNHHVSFLISEMKKGTFLHELATLATCVCDEDGKEYRVNGQHTSWSRLEVTEKEVPAKPISLLKYKAATLQDVRRLYSSFDRGAVRTRTNVIQSYLGGTDQFDGVTPTTIRFVATGLSFWLWESGHARTSHTGDDVAFLMQRDHADVVNKVVAFMDEAPSLLAIKFLRRAPVVSALLETFSKAQKPSEEFWYSIKTGLGFGSQDDPRLRLRNALMNSTLYNNTGGVGAKKKIDQESVYRWCIVAWNAWRAGEQVKILRAPNKRQRAK